MSKRKHNISYIKPNEPKFLRELKEQAGYKEGPTVDTKREKLTEGAEEDYEDRDEEQPVVVVLNNGDLTAEEADAFEKQKQDEEANAPADLSKRVIFRKSKVEQPEEDPEKGDSLDKKKSKKCNSKNKQTKSLLSFNDEEEEEDGT